MAEPATRVHPGRRRRVAEAPPAIRLAQLVRSPAPAASQTAIDGGLVVEIDGARVTIGRGADVSTLVTVLALLRGTGR